MSGVPYKYQAQAEKAMAAEQLLEAAEWYNKALTEAPNNPDIYNDRAVCYFHQGRKRDALADLDYAVQLQPEYSYRYASRAYIKSALKDIDGAIQDYQKAVELDPEDAIALNNLGLLEEQLGYMQKAQERYKQADALNNLLGDSGITLPEAPQPRNIQREINQEEAEKVTPGATWREVRKALTNKDDWKAFMRFVSRGFRLDNEDK